jgi:hypothetical protein
MVMIAHSLGFSWSLIEHFRGAKCSAFCSEKAPVLTSKFRNEKRLLSDSNGPV